MTTEQYQDAGSDAGEFEDKFARMAEVQTTAWEITAQAAMLLLKLSSPQPPPPTGWDNGLSQDYCKGLGQWLANRPGARQQLREMLVDPTGAVMVEYDIGSESTESAIRQKLIDLGWTPPGADQSEDVRAMVPMTDSEVSTALNGIGSSGLLMRIVRAVEAHHGIK